MTFPCFSIHLSHPFLWTPGCPPNSGKYMSTDLAVCRWLKHVILPTWEAEMRRISAWGQPIEIAQETLSQKYPTQKRADRVVQVVEWLPSKHETASSNPRTSILSLYSHFLHGEQKIFLPFFPHFSLLLSCYTKLLSNYLYCHFDYIFESSLNSLTGHQDQSR
jgi:hypothetical protein